MAVPEGEIDHQALYDKIKDKPCKVVDLETRVVGSAGGPARTRHQLIDRELDSVYEAKTLGEIHAALEQAGRNLQSLDIFRRVDILVHEEPQDDPEAVTVQLNLEEKKWYKINAATYFQGGENSFEMGAGLHNLRGCAEHITASAEYGSENSSQASLVYEQPRIGGLPIHFDARLHQFLRNSQKSSSFVEKLRGGQIGIKSLDMKHALQYELGWRSITDPSKHASRAVLAQTGDFLKSALRYAFFLDKRDSPVAPTKGWAVKCTSELGGLGPDSQLRYGKQQVDFQGILPLGMGAALSLSASGGVVLPWGGPDPLARPTSICERFFLGGPTSLRGFKFKGVGPSQLRRPVSAQATPLGETPAPTKRDALGGDLYASVLAALTFQLPHPVLKSLNMHGQVFVNGGNNMALAGTSRPLRDSINEFGSQFRWSTGAGLYLPTWFGRFEANYVVLLSSQPQDSMKKGFQLGFSTSLFA
ncbi:MAG: hypothetical protein WDW38_010472 [Sanguina aurantia]